MKDNLDATIELLQRSIPHIVDLVSARVKHGVDGNPGRDGAPGPSGNDGSPGADGVPGADGSDGRGIVRMDIKEGNLHVQYSDGSDQVVGRVVGDVGAAGKDADPQVIVSLVHGMMADFRKSLVDEVESLRCEVRSLVAQDREIEEMSRKFIQKALGNA